MLSEALLDRTSPHRLLLAQREEAEFAAAEQRDAEQEGTFTELWRKQRAYGKLQRPKCARDDTQALPLGRLLSVDAGERRARVQLFARPEQTGLGHAAGLDHDLHEVLATDTVLTLPWGDLLRPCAVVHVPGGDRAEEAQVLRAALSDLREPPCFFFSKRLAADGARPTIVAVAGGDTHPPAQQAAQWAVTEAGRRHARRLEAVLARIRPALAARSAAERVEAPRRPLSRPAAAAGGPAPRHPAPSYQRFAPGWRGTAGEQVAFPAAPLPSIDLFAGAGGLSEVRWLRAAAPAVRANLTRSSFPRARRQGLGQAGLSRPVLAVEFDKPAACAYRKNFPRVRGRRRARLFLRATERLPRYPCPPQVPTVEADASAVLAAVQRAHAEGCRASVEGTQLPMPGEVGLVCGGPPCQGFSSMNQHNKSLYSRLKNSLVATFLGCVSPSIPCTRAVLTRVARRFVDLYRPAVAIMENVRAMAFYANTSVMRACIRALLSMGYQCQFGVLQAGCYGVPQTRRRAILLAVAPGLPMPALPAAEHSFPTSVRPS